MGADLASIMTAVGTITTALESMFTTLRSLVCFPAYYVHCLWFPVR